MKMFLGATVALAAAAPVVLAQSTSEGLVPRLESDAVVPSAPGEEGPRRFEAVLPFPLHTYQPASPEYKAVPRSTAVPRPISYDAVRKVETRGPEMDGPFLGSGSVAGSGFADGIEETTRSLGSLGAVTATSSPWIYHCRMFFSNPVAGGNFVCSGTLIDPKTMITAGHCVHGGPGESWMTNIVVSPAWDGDDDAYGSANGIHMGTWTSWTTSGDWGGDQGYVRLDRPIGFLTGWQGYGYNSSDSWWLSTTLHDTGYPAGCFSGAPNQLYYGYGNFDDVDSSVARSYVSWPCWFGGMSGGGLYYLNSGSRWVYGNNSHGWGKSSGVTTRMGVCRIEDFKFDYMRDTFIPGAYPSSLDIVPLRVRSDNTVQAGSGITNLSYVNANASSFNPPNATYYTAVYLSTNDNISTFDTLIQSHTYGYDFGAKSSVTIDLSTLPPTVPSATTPGNYWVGVIANNSDADVTNDDTDGWDAQPITVTAKPSFSLDTYGYISPGTAIADVSTATPDGWVGVYYSITGGGPFSTSFGTLLITPPYKLLHLLKADRSGNATGTQSITKGLAGISIWLQAFDFGTQKLSNGTYERFR